MRVSKPGGKLVDMKLFKVSWKIEVYAEDKVDAAKRALTIQRDPNSLATFFDVADESGEVKKVDARELEEDDD